ncbi:MAG: hypothetical protein NTW25_00820, partial [Candidatus Kapabacteria bacterium]|nr:hypothetical protein [Candidatus Kapabacteria bacterium]
WHIYGNEQQGRFVTRKPETTLYYLENISNDVLAKNFFRTMDKKQYELKDHLGNVRATIGDYKLPFNDATSTRGVAPFFVDEKAVNDYYPYGMLISDRSFNSGSSRYGYNGKENDNEVKGIGNQQDFSARIYDPRTGRFYSLDPLKNISAKYSGYQYASNTPIMAIDIEGEKTKFFNENMTTYLTYQILKTVPTLANILEKIEKTTAEDLNIGAYNYNALNNAVTKHVASTLAYQKTVMYDLKSLPTFNDLAQIAIESMKNNSLKNFHLIGINQKDYFTKLYILGEDINDVKPENVTVEQISRMQNLVYAIAHEIYSHIFSTPNYYKVHKSIFIPDFMKELLDIEDKTLKSHIDHKAFGQRTLDMTITLKENIKNFNLNSPAYNIANEILNIDKSLFINAISAISNSSEDSKPNKIWIADENETSIAPSGKWMEIK